MYIMHRDGVPEGDKKRLYQHARLALHEMDAVDNLQYLGVNVSKVRLPLDLDLALTMNVDPWILGSTRTRARSASLYSSRGRRRTLTTSRVFNPHSSTCSKFVWPYRLLSPARG